MKDAGLFVAIVAVGISAFVQIFTDPRITRSFIAKSLVAIAVYVAFIAIGATTLFWLMPLPEQALAGVLAALFGWFGLGFLGLVRFSPRLREPPAILMRLGIPDILCLTLVGGGLVWIALSRG